MRVLLLGDLPSPHTRRWVEALRSEVDLAVVGFGERPPGVAARSLGPSPASTIRQLSSVPAIRSFAAGFAPDVVHAHFASSYGVLAMLAGLEPRVTTAWGSDVLLLGERGPALRAVVGRALRSSRLLTFDASEVGDALARLAPGVPSAELVFGPPARWCALPRSDDRSVLSPRLPEPLYGIPTILRAFARADLEGWSLDVLTSGRPVDELRSLAHELGIGDRTRWWPRLDHEQVAERFGSAEVFCSIPRSDATASSLLEGMACGSFPIVTDLQANRRWIDEGANGLLVPFGDEQALARALVQATSAPELRARAAAANRARIDGEITWEAAVRRMLELYRSL